MGHCLDGQETWTIGAESLGSPCQSFAEFRRLRRQQNAEHGKLRSRLQVGDFCLVGFEPSEMALRFRYLSCIDECDDPIIKDACGTQAVRIQNKLISTIVHAIKALFRDLDAVHYEPKECQRYDLSGV